MLGATGCERIDRSDLGCSENPEHPAELVGWWRFEEGTGATVSDSSGCGNTATMKNGGWGPGKDGGGLLMDGGNDSILTVPLSESLRSAANAITVMAWTYRTDEYNVAVIAHQYPALFFGFHGPQFKWAFRTHLGRVSRLAKRIGFPRSSRADCYADPKHRADLDRWIHLAASYDGSRARLFVDGTEICSRPVVGAIRMSDSPLTLSGYLDGNGDIVDEISGTLDDVRIYNRALTDEEIRTIYLDSIASDATHPPD